MTTELSFAPSKSFTPLKLGGNLSIDDLVSAYNDDEFFVLEEKLREIFSLKMRPRDAFDSGIKAIIKGRTFDYQCDISPPTKLFMLLHTLGHYYFITRAAGLGIDRYDYIYETSSNGNAHVYRYRSASQDDAVVTQKILTDRIEFEVRANDFAVEMTKRIGKAGFIHLVRLYEPADIRYIMDVMEGGPEAIVPDHAFINRYVLSGLGVPQGQNIEGIFRSQDFDLHGIDWGMIETRKIEIHYL